MGSNKITDEGAVALSKAMPKYPLLNEINLSWNSLSLRGADSLLSSVEGTRVAFLNIRTDEIDTVLKQKEHEFKLRFLSVLSTNMRRLQTS